MSHAIDDIDAHIGAAGSIDRAAHVPGIYLAWCVNLQLISAQFDNAHEREILRVRYRELSPAAFFLKATGGHLNAEMLSEQGCAFTAHYYATYRAEHAAALYAAKDDWDTYASIAPALTKAYYAFLEGDAKRHRHDKHWWQVWRRPS